MTRPKGAKDKHKRVKIGYYQKPEELKVHSVRIWQPSDVIDQIERLIKDGRVPFKRPRQFIESELKKDLLKYIV